MRKTISMVSMLVLVLGLGACSDDDSTTAVCGNGVVETGEECDDGNAVNGDGCSATCTHEIPEDCGDGNLDTGEECDDGNNIDGDGCSAICTTETTGECGDGNLDSGEECDDGNTTDGDGCSSTCVDETNGECGDGTLDWGEECDDGNTVDGDGCEGDCTLLIETVCQTMTPLSSGTCEIVQGNGSRLIVGTVLGVDMIYRGGEVLVDPNGNITCVGCDCASQEAGATQIRCPEGVISPGLINSHDHITYVNNHPYTNTGERYEHRHQWRRGYDGHNEIDYNGGANTEQIQWGELRFLIGGATSVLGSGSAPGFLRNLDRSAQEGLGQPQADYNTFPLDDSSGTMRTSGCNYGDIETTEHVAAEEAYVPHVSEGINTAALNEFLCVSSEANGGEDLLEPQSAFIHGVGLTPMEYGQMGLEGTALIWSPRTNITLYGDTAQVTTAARMGVLIAIGTDWLATGSMNMQRELKCADGWNTDYLDGFFTDRELWLMATYNGAAAIAMDDAIGSLAVGRVADIAIFDGSSNTDHRAVIDAQPEDVTLVMRGGEVLYGDDALVDTLGAGTCDTLDVCSVTKRICAQNDIGTSYSALAAANSDQYELFFCGLPNNEPSCHPAREQLANLPDPSVNGSTVYDGVPSPSDTDGDGIADANDNCPSVFNPIRPMDNGVQPDDDDDGAGDVCDLCPMDANNTCTPPNPYDSDSDGIVDSNDNCPNDANPLQEDADSDGRGDVCDDCPNTSNPAPLACPVTIYDIKQGNVTGEVAVLNALVTGCADNEGYFLQVKDGDTGYVGSDHSGVFVYHGAMACGVDLSVGDRVDLNPATVQVWYGQIQLSNASITVTSSGEAAPAPVVVTSALAGGAVATALEGVLVTVENVVVSDAAPAPGPGDSAPTNEFEVDSVLRVDDLLYLISPAPVAGEVYSSITGILAYQNGNQKIEPRSASDVVAGDPILVSFGPAQSFIRVGQTGTSIPDPLTVALSGPVAAPTLVTLVSADPSALSVTDVTIPAGANSIVVPLTGNVQSANVLVTASLDGIDLTANVRVVGAAEIPQVVSLDPATATVDLGGVQTFTVTLDIPSDGTNSTVALALTPGTFGTLPAQVVVPADQISAQFDFTAGAAEGQETLTATLGSSTAQSTVDVSAAPQLGLIIVEVYYDHTSSLDNQNEWVKLYNGTAGPVDLSGYSLGWGGTDYTYGTMQLSGTVQQGECFLVGGPNGEASSGFPSGASFDLAQDFNPDIQNSNSSGLADGVALFDVAAASITSSTVPIDAVIYGTTNTNGLMDSTGAAGAVNVADAPATNSIRMLSDLTWEVNTAPTPLDCTPFPAP